MVWEIQGERDCAAWGRKVREGSAQLSLQITYPGGSVPDRGSCQERESSRAPAWATLSSHITFCPASGPRAQRKQALAPRQRQEHNSWKKTAAGEGQSRWGRQSTFPGEACSQRCHLWDCQVWLGSTWEWASVGSSNKALQFSMPDGARSRVGRSDREEEDGHHHVGHRLLPWESQEADTGGCKGMAVLPGPCWHLLLTACASCTAPVLSHPWMLHGTPPSPGPFPSVPLWAACFPALQWPFSVSILEGTTVRSWGAGSPLPHANTRCFLCTRQFSRHFMHLIYGLDTTL